MTPHAKSVFHGISFNPADRSLRSFGPEGFQAELQDPDVFSWIDVEGPDIEVLNEILRKVDIDLVLVSRFDEPEILPRIVERPDCLAFYLYEVDQPERHLDISGGLRTIELTRMILVLGSDYVITYHRGPTDAVDHVKASCEFHFRVAGRTPGFIAFLFLQRCLYDCAHLNLANDNYLDVLEAGLFAGDQARLAADLSITARNILTLKKLAASLHIVLMLLATKRSPFISNEARGSFNEMLQNALAVRAAVDSSRDMLDGILSSVQASAAHRTSEIARVLTVMSGILLPLSLIAGIYGMNFEFMPELKWRGGYFAVLGTMAGIAAALLWVFKRLGWMDGGRTKKS